MNKYDNSGSIARNKDKDAEDANPNWPDLKGKITVEGKEYWLSGWKKQGDDGVWYSLSVKPKEKQQKESPRAKAMQSIQDIDSDLPFANPYKGRLSYVV